MNGGIDFNGIFQFGITLAVGFISWSLKELYSKLEKRQDTTEDEIKTLRETVNENKQDVYKNFVTKDEHNRDFNALECKIDDMRKILMEVHRDIGKITGERGVIR